MKYLLFSIGLFLIHASHLQAQPRINIDTLANSQAIHLKSQLSLNNIQFVNIRFELKKHFVILDSLSQLQVPKNIRKEQVQNEYYRFINRIQYYLSSNQFNLYKTLIEENRSLFRQHATEKNTAIFEIEE